MENFNFTEFTQEEIQFIQKKQKSKQMVFAIIFKYYQQNYTFIDDLSQVSKSVITSIGEILNISPQINGISSRTNDNFIASIRYYS